MELNICRIILKNQIQWVHKVSALHYWTNVTAALSSRVRSTPTCVSNVQLDTCSAFGIILVLFRVICRLHIMLHTSRYSAVQTWEHYHISWLLIPFKLTTYRVVFPGCLLFCNGRESGAQDQCFIYLVFSRREETDICPINLLP